MRKIILLALSALFLSLFVNAQSTRYYGRYVNASSAPVSLSLQSDHFSLRYLSGYSYFEKQGLWEHRKDTLYLYTDDRDTLLASFRCSMSLDTMVLLSSYGAFLNPYYGDVRSMRYYREAAYTRYGTYAWEKNIKRTDNRTGAPKRYIVYRYDGAGKLSSIDKFKKRSKKGKEFLMVSRVHHFQFMRKDDDRQLLSFREKKVKAGRWHNDLKVGRWKYYNQYGQVARVEKYRSGMLVKTRERHTRDMKKRAERNGLV